MTSNIGSHYLLEGIKEDKEISEEAKAKASDELKKAFRPEFLNRVDGIILFKPLKEDEIYKIIQMNIDDIGNKLKDRQMGIEIDDNAKKFILSNSYSLQYGARPVKRFIQKSIETEIGKMILKGELVEKQIMPAKMNPMPTSASRNQTPSNTTKKPAICKHPKQTKTQIFERAGLRPRDGLMASSPALSYIVGL